MLNKALGPVLYKEAEKILRNTGWKPLQRAHALYQLLNTALQESIKDEKLHFATHFARLAYIGHKFQLPARLQFFLHHLRRQMQNPSSILPQALQELELIGPKAWIEIMQYIYDCPLTAFFEPYAGQDWPTLYQDRKIKDFLPVVKALVLKDDAPQNCLIAHAENRPGEEVRIRYDIPGHNDLFTPTVHSIRSIFGFPVTLHLLEVDIDEEGIYQPKAIAVEPDYLIDVSAIAECFQSSGPFPWAYLLKKYLPLPTNKNLLLGNVANFFLDELLHDADADFRMVFSRTFRLNPLAFCLLDDDTLKKIRQESQTHFFNLQQMVRTGFAEEDIDPKACYLEPSFCSNTYGLQGRLDVWKPGKEKSAIVELKSGKPFRPNIYGISPSHFAQTMLYDLLVHPDGKRLAKPASFILYSCAPERPLRYAPRVQAQQHEALQMRNHLIAIEWLLASLGTDEQSFHRGRQLFLQLDPAHHPEVKGFIRDDLDLFQAHFTHLSTLEKKYFIAFCGFIAREQRLAKVGDPNRDDSNGLASLWLDSYEHKKNNFNILNELTIHTNHAKAKDPVIVLQKTGNTIELANFRSGDICVLYPHQAGDRPTLSEQIFKCTLLEQNHEWVKVKLRSRQFNDGIFQETYLWNIERDVLDSGFQAMYRGLFEFAKAPQEKRDLLLAIKPPKQPHALPVVDLHPELTAEQGSIFEKTLASPDYFLLWGPPGTGKTSVMLQHLTAHLIHHTEEKILLLAYTNRAVDEICEAVEQCGDTVKQHYIRISSRNAGDPRFEAHVLENIMDQLESRKALVELLQQRRIFVATVATLGSKPELLKLVQFDRVIVDEASQILEPFIIGLLANVPRFILIGDHQQLPAVVTQTEQESMVSDPGLNGIGLSRLSNSLFERLFLTCRQKGWTWAYAQLSRQGRMHQDIMAFPNMHFYNNTLDILPEGITTRQRQMARLPWHEGGQIFQLSGSFAKLVTHRLVFLPTPADLSSPGLKTNLHEAQLVVDLVNTFIQMHTSANLPFHSKSLGVITPYRAQIALIVKLLEAAGAPLHLLTVDTVERYQGGARDVIILSLCTNSRLQMQSMVSVSADGADRKLNVALTRAKEQVVVLGNKELLRGLEVYRELVGW